MKIKLTDKHVAMTHKVGHFWEKITAVCNSRYYL